MNIDRDLEMRVRWFALVAVCAGIGVAALAMLQTRGASKFADEYARLRIFWCGACLLFPLIAGSWLAAHMRGPLATEQIGMAGWMCTIAVTSAAIDAVLITAGPDGVGLWWFALHLLAQPPLGFLALACSLDAGPGAVRVEALAIARAEPAIADNNNDGEVDDTAPPPTTDATVSPAACLWLLLALVATFARVGVAIGTLLVGLDV